MRSPPPPRPVIIRCGDPGAAAEVAAAGSGMLIGVGTRLEDDMDEVMGENDDEDDEWLLPMTAPAAAKKPGA